MVDADINLAIETARVEISKYLENALGNNRIDQQLYEEAKKHTFPNLERWLKDPYIDEKLPHFKEGICSTITKKNKTEKWEDVVNAFRQSVRFGTGGIRGLMAFDKTSIKELKRKGREACILKGPNTINDLVFLRTSLGVAKFGENQRPRFRKVVIGYDSRINGDELSVLVARLFLGYGYIVYLFDAPCPYPEVTFAIPYLKADVGILISASHNDYRYNGYKLSSANGSQFDPEERDAMYKDYITKADNSQITLCDCVTTPEGKLVFSVPKKKLVFLGGDQPAKDSKLDYKGRELLNIHEKHRDHVKSFLLSKNLPKQQQSSSNPLKIAYCAFHGAGREAVPRLLREVGFTSIQSITHNRLNELDGLFPSFSSKRGKEQQPDPGDPHAADVAVEAFKAEYPGQFDDIDILIGTDPDADRCGVVVKVPKKQRHIYGGKEHYLLPADDMWALVLWYRLRMSRSDGDAKKKFIVLSNTTSDSIVRLARKNGLGVIRTWVGFASLAAATRDVWNGKQTEMLDLVDGRNRKYSELCHPFICDCQGMEGSRRSINVGAMEQSNGFSILGGPPPDRRSLGIGGHVRDKDGTFAALLVAEISAWAKERGKTLMQLLDSHIYSDPDIGLFVNLYEPDPRHGEYPGIEGDRRKKAILRRALGYYQLALSGGLEIGGQRVKSACIYRTGKYDEIYPPTHDFQFPDEGIRFFFEDDKANHLTIRPSGTGNSLRFHIQLHSMPTKRSLTRHKKRLYNKGRIMMDHLRELLKAPRA